MKKWLMQALCIYKVCLCLCDNGKFDEDEKNADNTRDSEDDFDIDWEASTSTANASNYPPSDSDKDWYNASFRSSENMTVNPIRSSLQSHQNRLRRNQEGDISDNEPHTTESKLKSGLASKRNSTTRKVQDLDSEKFVRFGR
jgi:hypothetical protein